jgi:hypothetical protein
MVELPLEVSQTKFTGESPKESLFLLMDPRG